MATSAAENSNANDTDAGEDLPEGTEERQQEAAPEGLQEVEAVVDVAPKPPSRRQQIEAERAEYRRDRERWAEEQRKTQEQFARMERMFQERMSAPAQQPERRQEPPARNFEQEIAELSKKQRAAFKAGNDEEWHEYQAQLTAAHAERIAEQRFKQFQAGQQQNQRQEQPPWVRAVEASYPDVLAHRFGVDVVRANVSRLLAQGKPESYETLAAAFEMSRSDLGTRGSSRRTEQQDAQDEDGTVSTAVPRATSDRRAMMGNGPAAGVSGRRASGGSDKEVVKGLHPRWESIAKSAGMTKEEYIKYHKEAERAKRS